MSLLFLWDLWWPQLQHFGHARTCNFSQKKKKNRFPENDLLGAKLEISNFYSLPHFQFIQKMLRIWSPRSLWGYLYKCSLQRTLVGVPPKKCQMKFHWIPVEKQSFDQRVRLHGVTNFTEGSLERYATLSVKRSHFFVVRRLTKKN